MIKLNGVMLSEKGVVRPQARKAIVEYVASNSNVLAKAKAVKGGYVLEVQDNNGDIAYVNFEMSVSVNSLESRAAKTKTKTKTKVIMEHFDIED